MTLDLVSKESPFLLEVLGDFHTKLSQWHDKDSRFWIVGFVIKDRWLWKEGTMNDKVDNSCDNLLAFSIF